MPKVVSYLAKINFMLPVSETWFGTVTEKMYFLFFAKVPVHQGFLTTSSEKLFSDVPLKEFAFTDSLHKAVCR